MEVLNGLAPCGKHFSENVISLKSLQSTKCRKYANKQEDSWYPKQEVKRHLFPFNYQEFVCN